MGVSASLSAQEAESDLVDLVVQLLADQDKDVRALALEQVRTAAKGEAATRQFAAQLPKLSAEAQVGLLGALAARGDAAARGAVLELLAASRDETVRVAAIAATGALGGPADARRLVSLLDSGPKTERQAARAALVQLRGTTANREIVALMPGAKPQVRVALMEILAARRAVDAVDDLLAAAVDENASVRTAAMTALGQLAAAEHLPGMVAGVLKAEPGGERAAAEKCVMFVCNRSEDPAARADPLLAVMEDLDAADRTALLSALGRVGGPRALAEVTAAIDDPTRHEIGVRALCNWPNASIADRLIEIAQSDDSPDLRLAALRALVRVAPLPDGRPEKQRLKLLRQVLDMCQRDEDRHLALKRSSAIRIVETLRLLVPYLDEPDDAQVACLAVVELAHHRGLREPNKAEFHKALDKVIATSQDPIVVERANRYKKGQTWAPAAKPK